MKKIEIYKNSPKKPGFIQVLFCYIFFSTSNEGKLIYVSSFLGYLHDHHY